MVLVLSVIKLVVATVEGNVLFKGLWGLLVLMAFVCFGLPLGCSVQVAKAAVRVPLSRSHDKCPSRIELESRFWKKAVWHWLIRCPKTGLWQRFDSEPIQDLERPFWHLFVGTFCHKRETCFAPVYWSAFLEALPSSSTFVPEKKHVNKVPL